MFPPFQVALSTLLVHTAMYTTYLHLHCTSLYIFKQRKNRTSNPLPILLASTTLFALITAQWVLTLVDTVAFFETILFTSHSDILHYTPAPAIYDGLHGKAKILLYVAQTAIGDGFFAYRLYLVWARRWVVLIFPGLCILCLLALGVSCFVLDGFPTLLYPVFGLTAATNVAITGTIITRSLHQLE